MASIPDETSELATLAQAAHDRPICSDYTNLEKEILERRHGIQTVDGVSEFNKRLTDPDYTFESDVIVRSDTPQFELDRSLTTYTPPEIPYVGYTGSEYTPELNTYTDQPWFNWEAVETATISQSDVSDIIVRESTNADIVAVVIIDGLSYRDWTRFGNHAQPVYLDCPTVTHCGYPNVVSGGEHGQELVYKLYDQGFTNRLAFTYWEKENNDLTTRLHQSFSPTDVVGDINDFSDVITYLESEGWKDKPTYLQITLTGPERVAHKLKEDPDLESEVALVESKLANLQDLLLEYAPSVRIFGVADHGILWRMDTGDSFTPLAGDWDHTKRRHIQNPQDDLDLPKEHGRYHHWDGDEYFQLDYPYLFHSLRSNEPGTHGGFSFEESVVPLIRLHQR